MYGIFPIFTIFLGLITAVAAGIFMLFPPRKPNAFYGYRSRRSRKTEETWRFAQKYSARSLAAAGLICLLFGFAQEHLQIFNFRGTEGFWYGFLPIILLPISAGIATEIALRRKFRE